ncbi:MAG: metallophosphoesterase [Muribaculum sp.]|nr:metallophosphoesterase [Muribaculaceae bacterium]MCM1080362.1 metallophosphoesterase [Muribaculum sp.]
MSLIVVFNLIIDFYIWLTIKRTCRNGSPMPNIYAISSALFVVFIIVAISLPRNTGSDSLLIADMWMIYTYFSIYIPKLIFCIVSWLFLPFRKHKRRAWLSANIVGVVLAFITFAVMWWAAAINRISHTVREVNITAENLPSTFDGYRILQFSDLHTGTFGNDTSYVKTIVDAINELHPNLVVFTGDIVNRRTDEIYPFINTLSGIKAPDGVISILGNHDYGDYSTWPNENAKIENMRNMIDSQQKMGWQLLLNNHKIIRNGNDSLVIIGVENWGEPPFTTYGNLNASYDNLSDNAFKILLSHNPKHWEHEVMNNDSTKIDLTMAGHTHAMQIQFGHWSPSRWRYKYWGGLYTSDNDKNKRLYVNIGLGTVGIPARIGATPELTLFTLHKK